ncbi:MAG: hypothetical protein JST93_01970 [Acidobacteria bacterium]|nr:hypothetical protein [Acidobacteriota bacterium]
MKGGRVVEKKQEPKIAAKDAVPAMVIRSCCRRPLLFRSPNGTLRLAPGESLEMPETWTGGVELRRLMQSGLVVCAKPERLAPAAHQPAAVEEGHPLAVAGEAPASGEADQSSSPAMEADRTVKEAK